MYGYNPHQLLRELLDDERHKLGFSKTDVLNFIVANYFSEDDEGAAALLALLVAQSDDDE